MKIYNKNHSMTNLTKNDYVSSGGQGAIYKRGQIAYKIYHDKNLMIPEAKIDELKVLNNENIISPQSIYYDDKKNPIGFSLKWVEGIPLCKIFVSGYQNRNGIKDVHITQLITNIKKIIEYIHLKNILIVDGNEMNYLVGNDFTTSYLLDVDSWQTKSYSANAIMDSIHDLSSPNKFTELTDWYSFAVIACWTFTGIHPFKGTHPAYEHLDALERMKQRSKNNISIFNKDVKVSKKARMDWIPKSYKEWFIRIFERGERLLPPNEAGIIQRIQKVFIDIITTNFEINLIETYNDQIINHIYSSSKEVITTNHEFIFNRQKLIRKKGDYIVFSLRNNIPIFSCIENEKLKLENISNQMRDIVPFLADQLMVIDNTIYFKHDDKLNEIKINDIDIINHGICSDYKAIPAIRQTWKIMPNSSEFHRGVIIQEIFGETYLTIPIPSNEKSKCYIKEIKELNGLRIIDAKHENRIVSLYTRNKKGEYKIFVIRFDKNYSDYIIFDIECDDVGDINMTVLPNGVCVLIPFDGDIRIFTNQIQSGDIKRVKDIGITMDMRLTHKHNNVMFYKENKLYSFKMKA